MRESRKKTSHKIILEVLVNQRTCSDPCPAKGKFQLYNGFCPNPFPVSVLVWREAAGLAAQSSAAQYARPGKSTNNVQKPVPGASVCSRIVSDLATVAMRQPRIQSPQCGRANMFEKTLVESCPRKTSEISFPATIILAQDGGTGQVHLERADSGQKALKIHLRPSTLR